MLTYRPNVAMILRNAQGEILICERTDWPGSWQFPQGGMKCSESPLCALVREVREEIGLSPDDYRVVTSRHPYRYHFRKGRRREGFSGQEQTYFLADLVREDPVFDFGKCAPEFCAARWIVPADFDLRWLPPMKREVYRSVFRDFFGIELPLPE